MNADDSRSSWQGDAPWWLALGALAILIRALVQPFGEFPLNDDWSYARAVKTWLETGSLRFTGWTSVPLIAQTLWGALFCLPHGFSFAALRLSTAIAGLLGVWGMFFLVRSLGRDRLTAAFAALTLAVNPLYVNLSQTFMTDVPFTAATIWGLAGFIRALSDPRRRWLWLGFLGSLVATLIRHPGIVLPLAFFLATRLGPRDAVRSQAGWPGVWVTLALVGFCAYASAQLGLRPFWTGQAGEWVSGLGGPVRMLERAGEIAVYLGLFGLPFGLFCLAGESRRDTGKLLAWIVPLAALTAIGLARMGIRLPFAGNVLYDAGLGPVRLYDVATLGLPHGVAAPAGYWTLITGLGVAGALFAGFRWFAVWHRLKESSVAARRTRWLLALSMAGWIAPMLVAGYFDRYLLVLLPPWLVSLSPGAPDRTSRSRGWMAGALAVAWVWAAFAVAATHDYFSWNRARWAALDQWGKRDHVALDRLDGGFEFNGWHRYDPDHPADRQPSPDRSWWWVGDEEVVITLGPVPGYTELARYPFARWLGRSPGAIQVLRREESSP